MPRADRLFAGQPALASGDNLTVAEADALSGFQQARQAISGKLTFENHLKGKENALGKVIRQIDGTEKAVGAGTLELLTLKEQLGEEIRALKRARRKREEQCGRINQLLTAAFQLGNARSYVYVDSEGLFNKSIPKVEVLPNMQIAFIDLESHQELPVETGGVNRLMRIGHSTYLQLRSMSDGDIGQYYDVSGVVGDGN